MSGRGSPASTPPWSPAAPWIRRFISKVYPTRSHSISAQGGTAAPLGNMEEDNWEWHLYDTVRGGDYLGDQDAQEILVRDAVEVAYELEHMGCPFSRTDEGKIAQREFGGHYSNFGKGGTIRRMCYAADRTGHAMLHTLYEQCIKNDVRFYSEFFVLSLLVENNVCSGVVAWDMRNGGLHVFHAKTVMFATGGYARAWKVNTNALSNTGDGMALVLQAGLPLEDMEFVQFHPTGPLSFGSSGHGRSPGRGRLPGQQRRQAVHGEVCRGQDGAVPPGCGFPVDSDRRSTKAGESGEKGTSIWTCATWESRRSWRNFPRFTSSS